MIKCQTCGTGNLDNSQYCDECGAALKANREKVEAPSFQPQFSEVPNIQQASVTSVGIPMFIGEADGGIMSETTTDNQPPKGVHATLLIERGTSVGTEFRLTSDESYIGRWDADNGIFP